MSGWLSAHRLVGSGWGAIFLHRHEFLRLAALPAFLWLFVKALGAVLPAAASTLTLLDLLTSAILVLFVVDWFRFSLTTGVGNAGLTVMKVADAGAAPLSFTSVAADPVRGFSRGGRMLARILLRIATVVLSASAILLPPTLMLTVGLLAVTGQLGNHAATAQAVSIAMPFAALLASPWLVRFYVYYAALAAGRSDVGARDVWRWSRGKSLWLVALLALSLAPGLLALGLANAVSGQGGVLAPMIAYIMAMPVFFLSLGVMASATAKAMAGLVLPPVMAA